MNRRQLIKGVVAAAVAPRIAPKVASIPNRFGMSDPIGILTVPCPYAQFRKKMLRGAAAGLGPTYEQIAGDIKDVSYRSVNEL